MTQLGDDIERIMLNGIRFRDEADIQLAGDAGLRLAFDDRRWLLRYIDCHCRSAAAQINRLASEVES